ncbi:MAG: pyridoxine 5'-phosphate synthase [Candidatus Omnitrophota bacterium]
MLRLGVNVDHVATLRQARGGKDPDPVEAAKICEKAGAHSIVMHLREDRRHIQDADLFRAKRSLAIKFNLEMSIAPSIVKIAARLRPEQATLVPEKRRERTTEGGLDLFKKKAALRRSVETLKQKKILVSLFIDPDLRQLEEAAGIGADAVEFHTGDYANQRTEAGFFREWKRLGRAVQAARERGITAHAGHGLDYRNVKRIVKIKGLEELNIGYSIVTRSVWVGLDRAVREMRGLLR